MKTEEITQEQVREWFIDANDVDELPANCPLTFAEICERLADDETPTPDGQMHLIREYGSTFAEAVKAYREAEEDAAAMHKAEFEEEAGIRATATLKTLRGEHDDDEHLARELAIEQLRYEAAVRERAAEILENEEDEE